MAKLQKSGVCVALAAAVLGVSTFVWAQGVGTVPAAGGASQPAADPDNTGKPEDPAGPQSREPGDLMGAGAMVYVDDSFASVDKLRTAMRSANQGQAQLAIKQFQEITDQFGQKLVLLNDNSYVSITDFVRERLLAMPAVKNGMYDQFFGNDAKRAVDGAIENQDVAGLIRTCDRYYPSAAALRGYTQAGEWYFERGEFVAAAQTWRKLLAHPLVGDRQAQLLFDAAAAETLARDGAAAQTMRDQLEKKFPDAMGVVSGMQVKLLTKLDELMALPAWEKTELGGDDWPAFEGGPSRSRLFKTSASIGARLWGFGMGNSLGVAGQITQTPQVLGGGMVVINGRAVSAASVNGDMGMLTSHPVMSNGIIFIHSGGQVIAVSANSGAKQWAYPADAASIDQATQQYIRNYGVNPRMTAHDSATVYGDQVFAVLPSGPVNQGAAIRYVGNIATMPTRVACLNREDGKPIWSRAAAEIKLEKEGVLSFVGSPLVTRQGVFVMARKSDNANFSQQYLVRLDRTTGEATWSCYLCSTNNLMYGNGLSAVPVPTLVDDILYISTGQGADCAVDANAGRILWLRPTITAQSTGAARGRVVNMNTVQAQMTGQYRSWTYNPPVVIGDTLLTTDTGQFLRLYNRWNGQLIKAIPAADLLAGGQIGIIPTVDVLAGSIGTKVVMSIRNVSVCYELDALLKKDLQPEWTATVAASEAGAPKGRPFLSESGYYVPFDTKLVRVDVKSGKAEQWVWPDNESGKPGGPGNLLVTSEQVIVVNDQEVAGYSKWETARDNRLAKIAAEPKDPETYLALAEVSFRTNHQDLARENMKASVDLANAGGVPAGKTAAELLGRLYRTNLSFAEQLVSKNDAAQWGEARFYYEESHASARLPEQQAEWRIRLADLARQEKKFEEAVKLYTEVLTDPVLRSAGYQEAEYNQSAGSMGEMKIKEIITTNGRGVYKRAEDEAAALTDRGIAAKETATLQKVVDGYPNSTASIKAATALAGLYQNNQNLEAARQVLWWLAPRLGENSPEQARAYANLAVVCMGLKRFESADAWASRGLSHFKDFTWTENGKKISFSDLKAQIAQLGGSELEGRLPALRVTPGAPEMESPAEGPAARKEKDLISFLSPLGINQQLLVPVEGNAANRPPSTLFVRSGGNVSIIDVTKATPVRSVKLKTLGDAVLLGATKETAVILQRDNILGVDLDTLSTWTISLPARAGGVAAAQGRAIAVNGQRMVVPPGANIQIVANNVLVNGVNYGNMDTLNLYDQNGNPILGGSSGSDPEAMRKAAFSTLGQQIGFTSARMMNGKVFLLAGNELSAYDIKTGKSAWTGGDGAPLKALLPPGAANCFVGNEDLIVAQVDSANGKGTIFCAVDSETGKQRKILKLDNERVQWRGLGQDGSLYVITDVATAAYDMAAEMNHAVWRRTDIGNHFAAAAQMTLDGLVTVTDEHDVRCLALESGDTRWTAGLKLELLANAVNSNLRSSVQGDIIVYQSPDGSAAYKTQTQSDADHQVAWIAAKISEPLARQSMQMSDALTVELLQGALPSRAGAGMPSTGANLVLRDRKGGRIYTDQPVVTQGSSVKNWQVIDGGIVFELVQGDRNVPSTVNSAGQIYVWKAAAPAH